MKNFFFFFCVLSCITFNLEPESSLTNVTSWFSSNTEKTYNKTFNLATGFTLNIKNTQGSITIHTWSEPKVALDVVISGKEKELEHIHVEVEEDKKTKTLSIYTLQTDSKAKAITNYEVMVPDYTPLTLITDNGDLKIKKSKATITAKTGEGKITITEARESLFIYTGSGAIDITYKKLLQKSTLQIEAGRGNITLSLPAFSQANIAAKTLNGSVTTEQEVMLKPQQVQLGPEAWKQFKQQAFCTLGNGGAAISLFTKNGNINITELP